MLRLFQASSMRVLAASLCTQHESFKNIRDRINSDGFFELKKQPKKARVHQKENILCGCSGISLTSWFSD